ncbi:hypothetical protein A2V54_02000 [candidate division WWE3 bacterium RBG_19FT_COMBO_53_11]|uniref:General secretion pathway GspH domain-containing protein n=1 Tax=candidate division WWE3 bacterium RBG_19FT_COMBO_53_11 TaxID=1802613 RepID=A0A1F4UJY6_UNCKA|nr:MAG: hypothetical protein A2155_01150 [candidate division WWE3 bacterium RBG_16_52_45]OGC44523.1 MAG: hypothetical protein A2V54_02000 [candidate division WWE3 bacterium RBG_19FT_COMBO_53_11]
MLGLETKNKVTRGGFTILEILLSIAVIGILSGILIPVSRSFQLINDLDVAANTTVQTLRRAQLLSQAMDGDTSWGVRVQSGNITLFKGASYASRDPAFDETFSSPSVTVSGLQEVVFSKFLGTPQTTGTLVLTSANNEVREIVINGKGRIDY